jgi:hypothetical protein
MTEEATITIEVTRQIALQATEDQPTDRKIAKTEVAAGPVRRVTARDFFSYFA